jgi:hypothetical protein
VQKIVVVEQIAPAEVPADCRASRAGCRRSAQSLTQARLTVGT